MEWIKVGDKEPDKYQNVLICTDDEIVKAVTYMGAGKWSTYCKVIGWMPYPEPMKVAPEESSVAVEQPKKRGRKKKA